MRANETHDKDKDLVRKAQAGDQQAFSDLIKSYKDHLECLIHLRLGTRLRRRVDEDDVLQETCLRAWRSIPRFRWQKSNSFYRWLAGIAEHVLKSLARKHLKAQRRHVDREIPGAPGLGDSQGLASPEHFLSEEVSPEKVLRRKERFDRLEAALNQLSLSHREVILLTFIHGFSTKEIAARMARSPDAVSMLLLRALAQLKSAFGHTDSVHLPPRSLLKDSEGTCGGKDGLEAPQVDGWLSDPEAQSEVMGFATREERPEPPPAGDANDPREVNHGEEGPIRS